jgi:hypothetical protein
MHALKTMELHHAKGLGGAVAGTVSGFGASVALGTLYGWRRDKWYGKWMPLIFALGGKLGALGAFLALGGKHHVPLIVLNDIGQAGVNALGLDLGVKAGLKLAKKQLVVMDETGTLPGGATRIAGELPPADPGRGLENITVEDLANLQ